MSVSIYDTLDTAMSKGNTKTSHERNRSRNWVFTLNNYDTLDLELLKNIQGCKLIFQTEVGKMGTPHIQGCISFSNAVAFNSMKKLLPKAHIEICKNWHMSVKYCSKQDTYDGVCRYNNFGLDTRSFDEKIIEAKERMLKETLKELEKNPIDFKFNG